MHDDKLQYAFQPASFITNGYLPDNWPIEINRDENDWKYVAWGLGFGLETNEHCGCGLLKITTDPSQSSFENIENLLENKNAVILFNDELFYADQKNRIIKKIELTDSNHSDFNKLKAKFTDAYKLAERDELKLITSVTGHIHPAVRAYHFGDMDEWRTCVVMNLEDKSAVVYFSNSHNGNILADQIISPYIKLDHAFNYFFQTYGFARNLDQLEGITDFHGVQTSRYKPLHEEKKNTEKLAEPQEDKTFSLKMK